MRAAVERCWASLHTERAVAYRARRGGDDAALAVVVQRMVDADAAGVLFTADPVTGDAAGSPSTRPGAWGRRWSAVRSPRTRSRSTGAPGGSGTGRSCSSSGRASRPSTDAQAERLAALGVRIEALDAQPVDVEWCRDGDDLWVVQARPITSSMLPERVEGASTGSARMDPWNDSRSGDFLWTNTNVGEAIPDVMTPATWSMVQVFLSDAMATASVPPYRGWGRIGGRVYLNVSVMMSLSGAAGVGERRFRSLTAEVFGQLPEDLEIPPVPRPRLTMLRAIAPMAVHVLREARRDMKVLEPTCRPIPALRPAPGRDRGAGRPVGPGRSLARHAEPASSTG